MHSKSNNPNNDLSASRPSVIITDINGKQKELTLIKDLTVIGRLEEHNDISLSPDPQQLITRRMHCAIEIKNSIPWLIDDSKNGTFLKRNHILMRVEKEVQLRDDDLILILGLIDENDEKKYWELSFKDPLGTKIKESFYAELIYDMIESRLFVRKGDRADEITSLTPMEHKLIRFMSKKNAANDDRPVICTYDDIIKALWEDIYHHTANDVNHIVASLRKKIEHDSKEPRFLINIRGMGYRLVSNPE